MSRPERRPAATKPHTVEAATQEWLSTLTEPHSVLAASAVHLARLLDAGAGMATAAVAKELRATVKELTPNDGGDAFADFLASLPPPVRHLPSS